MSWSEPPAVPRVTFTCSVTWCGRTFLTAMARQHHIYHAHGAGHRKDDHSDEIDMALYLGIPRGRGARYWSRRIRRAFRAAR